MENNKELYALLKMYNNDSVSDNSEIVLAPQKKKKLTKHRRRVAGSGGGKLAHTQQVCGGRTVSLTLALSLLLCWLLTLTWLAVILNSQIQHLDSTIKSGGGVSSQDGLLSDSTDEQEHEDQWRAKRRPETGRGTWPKRRACVSALRACTLVLVFACVVATTTVMWLFIDVREQATFLRNQLDQVVAGSQGVPEALQKCHSLSKQLQQNQTALFIKLNLLSSQLNNFTSQVSTINNRLNHVEERFKSSPELIKVPHDLALVENNIASFGSEMQDLKATVVQLRETSSKLSEATHGLQANVTSLRQEMVNMSFPVASIAPPSVDLQAVLTTVSTLRSNLTLVNDTLSKKIQWAQEDMSAQNKQIVGLQERSENVSTRVTSLQNECSARAIQLTSLNTTVNQVSSQVSKQEERWSQMSSRVDSLAAVSSRLESNATDLTAAIAGLRRPLVTGVDNQTQTSDTVETPTTGPPSESESPIM